MILWVYLKAIVAYDPANGVEDATANFDANLPYEVYGINGTKIGGSLNGLPAGIYIVRQGKTVKKITVN